MKTTVQYLDAVKQRLNLPSDYALAKALGITRESISGLRKGHSAMGIETAMKMGEILQIEGHVIYSHGQIERAKKPAVREFWQSVSDKFSMGFDYLTSRTNPRRSLRPAWWCEVLG
jgi:DNA-binding XRE family transcriptional regulator